MVELVDTLDLGSSVARRGGSSPLIRTKIGLLLNKHVIRLRLANQLTRNISQDWCPSTLGE